MKLIPSAKAEVIKNKFPNKFKYFLDYVCFAMLLYGAKQSTVYYDVNSYSCQFTYGLYWAIFMLILLFLEKQNSIFSEFLNVSLIKNFGKYSFGIYLLHHDGLYGVQYLNKLNYMNKSGIEMIILALIIAYVLGLIFFHLIEVPSMNFGKYLIQKISSIRFFSARIDEKLTQQLSLSTTDL